MTKTAELNSVGFENDKSFVSCGEIFFFISYIPLLAYLVFETSFYSVYIDRWWKAFFILTVVILAVKELLYETLTSSELKGLVIVAFFAAVVGMHSMGPAGNSLLLTFLFAFCGRNIKFERIAIVSFAVITISIVVICLSAHYGIILDYIEEAARKRDYMGFRYSLYGPVFISNCSGLWLYLRKQKISIAEIIFLAGANYFFYVKTNARLSFFLTICMLVMVYLFRRRMNIVKRIPLLGGAMIGSFALAGVFSIVLTKLYSPNISWMFLLNSVLGGRLNLGKKAMEQYGFTLLGNRQLQLVGNGLDAYGNRTIGEYNYVDCFYIQTPMRYGVLFFILLIIVVTYAMYRSYVTNDLFYLFIMTFVAVHCIIDDLPQFMYYNTFWIAIGGLLCKREEYDSGSKFRGWQ